MRTCWCRCRIMSGARSQKPTAAAATLRSRSAAPWRSGSGSGRPPQGMPAGAVRHSIQPIPVLHDRHDVTILHLALTMRRCPHISLSVVRWPHQQLCPTPAGAGIDAACECPKLSRRPRNRAAAAAAAYQMMEAWCCPLCCAEPRNRSGARFTVRGGSALEGDSWGIASGELTYVLLCEVSAKGSNLQCPPGLQPAGQPDLTHSSTSIAVGGSACTPACLQFQPHPV